MKTPHLLRVSEEAAAFAALVARAAELGLRIGWLEWREQEDLPPSLEQAAALGMLRAVAAGDRTTVIVKPRRGPAILRDLIREHFRGAAAVLIRGGEEGDRLHRDGKAWVLETAEAKRRFETTGELARALRRPRLHPGGQRA